MRASDLNDWGADLEDDILPDVGETTTRTFSLTEDAALQDALFFRVEEE